MDILAALRQEETKFQKQADAAKQQLDTVRAAIKILGRGVANKMISEPGLNLVTSLVTTTPKTA
jgi:hypothetical protein